MKLGTENRKQTIAAIVLAAVLVLVIAYELFPLSLPTPRPASTATTTMTGNILEPLPNQATHRGARSSSAKKERAPQSLDPTLHLAQLASTEQIKYEGSGRNIFVAQAEDVKIPTPLGTWRYGQHKGSGSLPYTTASCRSANSTEVFRICQSSRRTKENFPLQRR